MQVRKFEAPTMQEAIRIIKQELGPDAIILSTKNNRKGFGLLSKASVEVTAAIAEKNLVKKQITERVLSKDVREKVQTLPATKQAEIYNDFSEYYQGKAKTIQERKNQSYGRTAKSDRYIDIKDENENHSAEESEQSAQSGYGRNGRVPLAQVPAPALALPRIPAPVLPASAPVANEDVENLKEDIQRLKSLLEEVKSEQTMLTDSRVVEQGSEALTEAFQELLRNGIDRKLAVQLIKQVRFSLPRELVDNSSKISEALAMEMMENIRTIDLLEKRPGSEQKVYSFIGPTGVGKTTTIAKIASHALLSKNLKVGLINLDNYRVGASDQLATYAKILNIPFRHATNENELERAINEFKPMDLILIDTTGRSQKDSENLIAMKQLLESQKNVESILILGATTRDQEIFDILNRFKIFKSLGLVFSKLDEASIYGSIYNVSVKTGLPLIYFTLGQRVPEDIESSTKERVVDLILDL